ncbi:MAG TPA: methyltransferase domain-containing protein [Actinomycetota bacterium]|nr:methyltransferase domain-containing protein [Actinomycetota bacterium]
MSAIDRWGDELGGWGIPDEILDAAPESPWGFPAEIHRVRAERAIAREPTASTRRALEALPDGGSVLDVGVGGGAASLPLAGRAALIVGVDTSRDMLEAFEQGARAAGVAARTFEGGWPDVAAEVPKADVVVCSHVLYNVRDLEPFVRALDAHARRRGVVEITATHPLAWMSDLWQRFHALERPDGPTADDAFDALAELGMSPEREDEARTPLSSGFERREDAVALVRRRLCLPAERDPEVAEALGDLLAQRDGLWSAGPAAQTLVTLWWDHRP